MSAVGWFWPLVRRGSRGLGAGPGFCVGREGAVGWGSSVFWTSGLLFLAARNGVGVMGFGGGDGWRCAYPSYVRLAYF